MSSPNHEEEEEEERTFDIAGDDDDEDEEDNEDDNDDAPNLWAAAHAIYKTVKSSQKERAKKEKDCQLVEGVDTLLAPEEDMQLEEGNFRKRVAAGALRAAQEWEAKAEWHRARALFVWSGVLVLNQDIISTTDL